MSNKANLKLALAANRVAIGRAAASVLHQIGDDVMLGAGCVLLGNIEVGDGAATGANAVVTKSVPMKCVAVGVPARIKERR